MKSKIRSGGLMVAVLATMELAGCASNVPTPDQKIEYAKTQLNIEQAKAEQERAKAEREKAKHTEAVERLQIIKAACEKSGAACVALGMTFGREIQPAKPQAQVQAVVAERPLLDRLFPWAGLVLQGLGIYENAHVGMHNSDNATALGIAQSTDMRSMVTSGYSALSSVAGTVQAPTTTYNIGADGVIGSGYMTTSTDNSNQGNSTATPTIVTQPAPIVVNP